MGIKTKKYSVLLKRYFVPRWVLYASILKRPMFYALVFSGFWAWFRHERSGALFNVGEIDQSNYAILFEVLGVAFGLVAARLFDDILKQYQALIHSIRQNDVHTFMKNRYLRSSRFAHLLLFFSCASLATAMVLLPYDSLIHNSILMFLFISFAVLWWNIATDLDNYATGKLRVFIPKMWEEIDEYDFWIEFWTDEKKTRKRYFLSREEIKACAKK